MAEISASSQGLSAGAWAQLMGGVVSVALIAGVGIWGAKLVMRDVSGLPVVKAQAGEMRVAPEDPGGEIVSNAGLAVNRLIEEGAAAATEEAVRLAPGGADVTVSDLEVAPTEPLTPEVTPEPVELTVEDATENGTLIAAPADPTEAQDAVAEASSVDDMVAALTEGVAPLTAVETPAEPAPTILRARPDEALLQRAAVRKTVLPARRPAGGIPRPTPVAAVAAALEQATNDLVTASVAPGTRLAQLGAYDSAELADKMWVQLSGRYDGYFDGKTRVIQEATSGGKLFYRLRVAGFEDLGQTRRFCSAMLASGQDCIPVVAR